MRGEKWSGKLKVETAHQPQPHHTHWKMTSAPSSPLKGLEEAMSKVKVTVGLENVGVDRHCAFCLTLVKGEEVVLCGGCGRRAYCSKECETADWTLSEIGSPAFNGKIHGYGQGHKNWCGLPYGEEDLDWKVAPISGKGVGLVALRDLPPLYRILVEGMQRFPEGENEDKYHPEIDALCSKDPSDLTVIWDNNCLTAYSVERAEWGPIGLRISRTNHSCSPNSAVFTDEEAFQAMVLFSNKGIKAGEEICWAYISFLDLFLLMEIPDMALLSNIRTALQENWGVVCPPTCVCWGEGDKDSIPFVKECRQLRQDCEELEQAGQQMLPKMERIVFHYETTFSAPPSILTQIYDYALFAAVSDLERGVAPKRAEAFKAGRQYLEKGLEIKKQIYHPQDQCLKIWRGFFERNYY